MTISAPAAATFNISLFTAAAAWNDNLYLSISGQQNGTTVYRQTITLQVTNASVVVLNWTLIDSISFTTSGGTVNSMFAGTYSGTQFAMDNLCVDVSSFYTTTTQVSATYATTSGSGGGGSGGGGSDGGGSAGGGDDGISISIGAVFGSGAGMTVGVGEFTTPVFGGIIGAIIAVLIILGLLLWCLITSKCCSQSPNCNGCRGGGC
ncbi:unnamed protein product [Rotaria sordida]|uniref:Uncharacterized protein n=1 Tax=Rotaria sordida TaxID=392033 RepID=A0A815TQP2_9BILA|nr:unnamed protein product [Rotaria sordida]CAF4182568.1 unnamed protein product [Rotaria sordida]